MSNARLWFLSRPITTFSIRSRNYLTYISWKGICSANSDARALNAKVFLICPF